MFDRLPPARVDSLMELGRLMQADPREDKIDLGVGTYRDETGLIPIMSAVKSAEAVILREQTSKGYVGPSGDAGFALSMQEALFPALEAETGGRIGRIQTPGGTGALRLALELIAKTHPQARVWVGIPTWPAHLPLVAAVGLEAVTFAHLKADGSANESALFDVLEQARSGDVILMHGCCHNPTGADFDQEVWVRFAEQATERGLIPLVDLAYPGLGESLAADVQGVHRVLARCPNALVAVSCSKSFGLYRDRTGMLMMAAASPDVSANLAQKASAQARLLWSNPPDHGAAVVRTVLASGELTAVWHEELDAMRHRVNAVRQQIADIPLKRLDLSRLASQKGMFALLPLSPAEVVKMREDHAIYMDISGRINVAGLNPSNINRFAEAIAAVDAQA